MSAAPSRDLSLSGVGLQADSKTFPVHMHRKELTQCFSYVQHRDSELARGLAVADQTNEEAIYITCGTLNIQGVKDMSCCAMFGT